MKLPEQDKLKIGQEVSQNVPTPTDPSHAVNKEYVDNLSKEVKEITNTTQYTVVADDVDKVLDFIANAGEEIDLIINTGVIPANKSIQFISSGNNIVVTVEGSGVTLAQTEGSKLKSKGKGSFVEILSTTVAETFAVTGDLEKDIISGKDIELRSPNTSSEIKFYDSETTEDFYFYLRGNAAENIFEIGSKDSSLLPEVTAMFFDRGKDFTVSKGYFRSMNPDAALIIQTPSGDANFKNPNQNIKLSSDGDFGIKAVRLETSVGDKIVWQSVSRGTTAERPTSATHVLYSGILYFDTDVNKLICWDGSQWIDISGGGGGSIQNITEIPNRSYNDLQDLPWTETASYSDPNNTFLPADIGKVIAIQGNLNIIETDIPPFTRIEGFNDSNSPVSVTVNNATTLMRFAEGYTNTIKPYGRFVVFRGLLFTFWGDIVKEYEITASPDGTLWKTGQVDNSGNPIAPTQL